MDFVTVVWEEELHLDTDDARDLVEHVEYKIRGEVMRYAGRFAEVLWDGESPMTEDGRRFLRNVASTNLDEHGVAGALFSSVPIERLRPVSVVSELADVVRNGVWPEVHDIGRGVVYVPHPGAQAQDGVITGFNDDYVFVRYSTQHPGALGQATRREDLRWAT